MVTIDYPEHCLLSCYSLLAPRLHNSTLWFMFVQNVPFRITSWSYQFDGYKLLRCREYRNFCAHKHFSRRKFFCYLISILVLKFYKSLNCYIKIYWSLFKFGYIIIQLPLTKYTTLLFKRTNRLPWHMTYLLSWQCICKDCLRSQNLSTSSHCLS